MTQMAVVLTVVAILATVAATGPPAHAVSVVCHDLDDCTTDIQAALDNAGNSQITIPNMGRPWITTPLFLRASNVQVVLEDGVVLLAKENEFHGSGDSLFTIQDSTNVTLTSTGLGTIQMRKYDYANASKYTHAEWRMGVRILGCTDVTLSNLLITLTGGDGIYVSSSQQNASVNVLLENVRAINNYRQGMSIISARGLMARSCEFSDTWGTAPQGGVDLEPNTNDQELSQISFVNCTFQNNSGPNFIFAPHALKRNGNARISVSCDGCAMIGGQSDGIALEALGTERAGTLTFTNTVVRDSPGGIVVIQPLNGTAASFTNTLIDNIGADAKSPILVLSESAEQHFGGVRFEQCIVRDPIVRPFIFTGTSPSNAAYNVDGIFVVANPKAQCTAQVPNAAIQNVTIVVSHCETL